jgi:hypothetical protein
VDNVKGDTNVDHWPSVKGDTNVDHWPSVKGIILIVSSYIKID